MNQKRSQTGRGFISGETGIALLMAMMLLLACAILAAGFLVLVHQENGMTSDQGGGMQALWLAEAAGQQGYKALRATNGNFSDTLNSGSQSFSYQGINGTIQYRLCPDPNNSSSGSKKFKILASGTTPGGDNRILEIQVRAETFAELASATDQEKLAPPEDATNFVWNTGDSAIGRVHSNDRFTFNGSPIFVQPITSASNLSYNGGFPIFRRPPYKYNMNVVNFPTSDSALQKAAWGQSGGYPTSQNVYLPLASGRSGGIYVVGDCQIYFDATKNFRVAYLYFYQGANCTQINIDYVHNQTAEYLNGTQIWSGNALPNGAIFVNGNVTSIYSSANGVMGAFTVGTDINAGQDITITNDLVYEADPRTNPGCRDILGLIARNVNVHTDPSKNGLSVNAFIIAGSQSTPGSFRNLRVLIDSSGSWGNSQGSLYLLGGVAQRFVGVLGRPGNGNQTIGYTRAFLYDLRGQNMSPPYFPITDRFVVTSWRELTPAGV